MNLHTQFLIPFVTSCIVYFVIRIRLLSLIDFNYKNINSSFNNKYLENFLLVLINLLIIFWGFNVVISVLNFCDIASWENNLLNVTSLMSISWDEVINYSIFLSDYYSNTENIWLDGFLFDFLQNNTVDAWVSQFVIYTGFLFSERLVFDSVISFYLDNLVWPLHYIGTIESLNVSEMLLTILFIYFVLFISLVLIYTTLLF